MYFSDWYTPFFGAWFNTSETIPVPGGETEPLTLETVKKHLRVSIDDDDTLIQALITTAREQCEHLTGRAIVRQTLVRKFDAFCYGGMALSQPPLVSVTSVQYIDATGVLQTLDEAAWFVDDSQEPAQLLPAYGTRWPETRAVNNAVIVTYEAGYVTCPSSLKTWILLMIGTLYENRERDSDSRVETLGFADRLLDRYRLWQA